ncbi:MAG: ABC transporter substrate-binding protein, partial [Acidimicrobiia bacterium]|nr:ABC transporter substrate-binding protein [Acidimicrobiia bacterium]
AGDQVKAVDSLSTYPAGTPVTDLSAFEPNLEAIAAQQPDLVVLGFANDEIQAGLAGLGIPVLLEEAASTLDDTYSQMTDLGLATGHPDEAAAAVASVRSGIDEVVKGMAATPGARPTVYHELDDTFYSASSGSFIGQLYQLLGYDNIADAADPDGSVGYPQLNAEQIIKANPDLIVITDAYSYGPADIAARPGWNTIKAVADDRVVVVNDDIASRWGPRVVDFLRTIADATPVPAGAAQQ